MIGMRLGITEDDRHALAACIRDGAALAMGLRAHNA